MMRDMLHNKIRAARIKHGLTQAELGQLSGVDPAAISNIESGRIRPGPDRVARIAYALGLPVDELFGSQPQTSTSPTVLDQHGCRFSFYSAEDNEPPHVHVRYGGRGAKFWLRPVRLAQVDKGWKAQDLRRAKQIAVQYEAELLQAWQRYEEREKR